MAESDRAHRPINGFGRLAEPLRILFDNRSLTWLVLGFGWMTLAEWGYVTALAVDAFHSHGSVAVGLVGFRLFVASVGSFFNISYLGGGTQGEACSAGIAATAGLLIVGLSAALAGGGRPARPVVGACSSRGRCPRLCPLPARAVGHAPRAGPHAARARRCRRGDEHRQNLEPGTRERSQAVSCWSSPLPWSCSPEPPPLHSCSPGAAGDGPVQAHYPIQSPRPGIFGRFPAVKDSVSVVRHPYVGGLLVVSGLRTFVRGMWIYHRGDRLPPPAARRQRRGGPLMLAAGIGALAAVPLAALIGRRSSARPRSPPSSPPAFPWSSSPASLPDRRGAASGRAPPGASAWPSPTWRPLLAPPVLDSPSCPASPQP